MAYDALAESVRLLDGAPVAERARLSRRVRHLPLAVDRDGDSAVTLFLRRGVSGVPELDAHAFVRTHEGWRPLGGGGGPGDEVVSARPRLAAGDAVGRWLGGGWNAGAGPRGPGWRPGRRPGVSWAELRLADEVTALRVEDRLLPVASHGTAVVVWTRRQPVVTALDAGGAALGPVPVLTSRLRLRDRL